MVASRCRHPNLIQLIGASNEGQLFIVTKLMHASLRNILHEGQLQSFPYCSVYSLWTTSFNAWSNPSSWCQQCHCASQSLTWQPVASQTIWLSLYTNFMLDSNTVSVGNVFYAAPEAILTYEICSREFPDEKPNPTNLNYVKWADGHCWIHIDRSNSTMHFW